jgi:sugar phosphate isomerase/epimerase
MLGPDDLLITASTLGNPPFRDLLEAAAAGGFAGLSIWPIPVYREALDSGLRPAELRGMLGDYGLVVNDVDALVCTGDPSDPGGGGMGRAAEEFLFEAGEQLGARFINVVIMASKPISIETGAEVFSGVCERAAEYGLTPYLEFVPFMSVPDAATAWAIVQLAGHPQSGVMVDSWHCFRGSTREEDLRAIPGERILGIQLNDAPVKPMDDPVEETLHHRLVPGEGAIDLVGLMRLLQESGSPAPRCLEIFSDELLAWGSPSEIAVRVGDAIRTIQRLACESP